MRTFLGVLMLIIVSGGEEIREGLLDDSVLLPCNCSERDKEEFQWQMEKPNVTPVVKSHGNTSNFYGRYKDRAKFPAENHNNCSILLTNITAEDQGKYRCSFHSQGTYQKLFVTLHISANYKVCQTDNNLNKVFQCDVKGRHREAWIQWNLGGQLLTNSTTTNITHTFHLDASTGLYNFHSTLSTKLNWTSEPTCDVKAKDISTIISSFCMGRTDSSQEGQKPMRHHYVIMVPIMSVLGLSLLLKYRWNPSLRLTRKREVETDSFY